MLHAASAPERLKGPRKEPIASFQAARQPQGVLQRTDHMLLYILYNFPSVLFDEYQDQAFNMPHGMSFLETNLKTETSCAMELVFLKERWDQDRRGDHDHNENTAVLTLPVRLDILTLRCLDFYLYF